MILVTGGGGFLGLAIVRKLLDRGERVRTLSRGNYPALSALGVEQIQGDIADHHVVDTAVADCDLVFHVAAKAGVWGTYESYRAANIIGTQNVIDACRKHGVNRLVYTSSPSVTFGGDDQEGIDESAPYPETFLAFYPHTKAEAERRVIAANDADLATVSLRPHLIWGPGDNHLVPRILTQGRAGKLRIVGTGANLVDSVYIDNAADAHILAGDKLLPGAPIAGRNYFITNDEPMAMAELINGILAAGGVPPVTRKISVNMAFRAGRILEGAFKLFGLSGEPRMTRFVARQLGTAHWFDISAAKQDLGYKPKVSIREGLDKLGQALATTN